MGPEYGLLVTPSAQRAMDRLPERVAAAIAELLTGDLLTAPHRAAWGSRFPASYRGSGPPVAGPTG
ncbi:MAG: hypothetical protein ACRDNZ_18350 [Streptosporangiaceae bacterium]